MGGSDDGAHTSAGGAAAAAEWQQRRLAQPPSAHRGGAAAGSSGAVGGLRAGGQGGHGGGAALPPARGPAALPPQHWQLHASTARRRVVRGLPHHAAEPARRSAACRAAVPHAAPRQSRALRRRVEGQLAGVGRCRCAAKSTACCLAACEQRSQLLLPAAWLRFGAGDTQLCCCSPERFLRGDRGGLLEAKPIKGTARRSADPKADAAAAAELAGGSCHGAAVHALLLGRARVSPAVHARTAHSHALVHSPPTHSSPTSPHPQPRRRTAPKT